jgi:hypothetical protein
MKSIITFCFVIIAVSLQAQVPSEYGNWFYLYPKKEPKNHYVQPLPFPQSAADPAGQIVYSAMEKKKMGKIVEALKEVYPKPKLNSYFIDLQALFNSAKMDKAKIAKRDYRFGYYIGIQSRPMYALEGKLVKKDFNWEWPDDGTLDFVTVNVNYIPDFLGGWGFEYNGPKIMLEEDFTYINKRRLENDKFKDTKTARGKTHIVSITTNHQTFADGKKILGSNYGVPALEYGNEADKHFVLRNFSSTSILNGKKFDSKEDRHKLHTVQNMVIMSHNGKLPLLPLSIEQYLNIADSVCNERIENHRYNKNFYKDDYPKNKKRYDDLEAKNIAEEEGNREFIRRLRQEYQNRLQDQAIVNIAYQQVFEYRNYASYGTQIRNKITEKYEPTASVIRNFFITDSKLGKAYYSYDKDFYKSMADGEIRTLAVIWWDVIRAPDHPDFGVGNSINKNVVVENRYTDNPDFYLHHFDKKFDWKKLESLLGK